MATGDPNSVENGQAGAAPAGVQAPSDDPNGLPEVGLPQYNPAQINEQLLDEIHHQITRIDKDVFKGVVEELAQLITEFRSNLSQFDNMQFTAPNAYSNLLEIVQCLTQLAQLMVLDGQLPADHDVVSDAVAQDIQSVASDQADSGGAPAEEDDAPSQRKTAQVGEIRIVMQNGVPKKRRKMEDGSWAYVNSGLGGQAGRQS